MEKTVTKKKYRINSPFDCNSCCVVYLLTCWVCLKQHIGSTVTRFRLRFNQYKSNIKLKGEGSRGFKQEKLIENFLLSSHNGTCEDIQVQIIGHCDPNDQEAREDFWNFYLYILHLKDLNQKCVLKYCINRFSILMSIFDLTLLGHTYKKTISWIITNASILNNLRCIHRQLRFNF